MSIFKKSIIYLIPFLLGFFHTNAQVNQISLEQLTVNSQYSFIETIEGKVYKGYIAFFLNHAVRGYYFDSIRNIKIHVEGTLGSSEVLTLTEYNNHHIVGHYNGKLSIIPSADTAIINYIGTKDDAKSGNRKSFNFSIIYNGYPKIVADTSWELPARNFLNFFHGSSNNKPIELGLFFVSEDSVKGYYISGKCENKNYLAGTCIDGAVSLGIYRKNQLVGYLKGVITRDSSVKFVGEYSEAQNQSPQPLKCILDSIVENAEFNHTYTHFKGSDEEIEDFMKLTENAMLNDDKVWIANHITYPYPTSFGFSPPINSKEELIKKFDLAFPPGFRKRINGSCPYKLYNTEYGISDGLLWIGYTSGNKLIILKI